MSQFPFTNIPPKLDRALRFAFRMRLLRAYAKQITIALLFVPIAATALFMIILNDRNVVPTVEEQRFAARTEVFAIQERHYQQAAQGVYYVKRIISEGEGKSSYLQNVLGYDAAVPTRVDTVETWQHNYNARLAVVSTQDEFRTHTFVSNQHDNVVDLYFHGDEQEPAAGRESYDRVHDLADLYQTFASTTKPSLPTIPDEARLVSLEPLVFAYQPTNDTRVEYLLDPTTKLIQKETVYVVEGTTEYEMATITYESRDILPASEFDRLLLPDDSLTLVAQATIQAS